MFRRLGTSLASHRASLSSELGSLWDFLRPRAAPAPAPAPAPARRRSAPAGCAPPDARSPARLARDLLQVVQETVFAKKFDERRCPLVKEESDLSSDEGNDRRIANLIDFFFTIVKSQKDDRKGSSGSCFKTESPTEVKPRKVNIELEKKMETLMEFLATTGCMEEDATKDEKKITLMEFLFGPENKVCKPIVEINEQAERAMTLSESNINVKLSYIDETPVEEGSNLVDMLIKYMETYETEPNKSYSLTPSLSEKSKSDVTLSKLETFSDNISKTKSDSTLTQTQDTVVEREGYEMKADSRRISETVVDLSHIKQDLEEIFDEAVVKVCELKDIPFDYDEDEVYHDDEEQNDNDTMSEAEDMKNFDAYTKPPFLYSVCMPYSVELSDILEEDESLEPSSRAMQEDRMDMIRETAEDLLDYIEDKIQRRFDDSSEDEFDISASLKRSSVSLIDLRFIPDLPPSMIIKPKVKRIDKSTSTTEISDSISDLDRRVDGNLTEDTSLSNSSERQAGRALDKIESLHKFFTNSRSRLGSIKEKDEEERNERKKRPRSVLISETRSSDMKPGQASLDDVEELQDEVLENNDIERFSEDVIIEENERDVSYEETDNFIDQQDEGFDIEDKERRIDEIIEDSIKVGTVSEIKLNEERTEELVIFDEDVVDDGDNNRDNDDETRVVDTNDACTSVNEMDKQYFAKCDLYKIKRSKKTGKPASLREDVKVRNKFVRSQSSFDIFKLNSQGKQSDIDEVQNQETRKADRTEFNSKEGHDKDKCLTPQEDKVITKKDFTEIDKIIADAVKIILINELEFHESELKLKKEAGAAENCGSNKTSPVNYKPMANPFDTDKELNEHKKEMQEFKSPKDKT